MRSADVLNDLMPRVRRVQLATGDWQLATGNWLLATGRWLLAAGCCLLTIAPARAEIIDRVLAVAAGELIMLSDVTAARDLGFVQVDVASGGDPIAAVLSRLIDRELVLAEVDRYAPPEPTKEAVDREVQNVRARFASAAAFEAVLARSGIDENSVRETVRQNLRIRTYEDQRFTVPLPNEEDLLRYYRAHPQAFTRNGAVLPFDAARPDVISAVITERKTTLVTEWVSGLRRRADVIDLYLLPAR